MGHLIGSVDDTSQLAHYEMLEAIKDFADDEGWDVLRFATGSTDHELILKAPGISSTEEIFCGFRTYHDVSADYYNLLAATFTGYVGGNTFDTQPGVRLSGIPAHNQHIDFWMTINGQRLALAMKVGTPVYEHAYVGKIFPYFTPTQYPYPVVCSGMLAGAAALRYSDTTGNHSMGYKGNSARLGLRLLSGGYQNSFCWPWGNLQIANTNAAQAYQVRPTGTYYPLLPVVLHDNSGNDWGELDGIYSITGFDNVVENTLTIGGVDYVVFQDSFRTGFVDYYAMRLDPNP